MKRVIILLIAIAGILTTLSAQVAINSTGAVSDASAMLDVQSTTKGFLVPRMTQAEKEAISSPATGLIIYQTDGTSGFYFYSGSSWVRFTSGVSSLDDLSDARTGGNSLFLGEDAGINDDLTNNLNVFVGIGSGKTNTTGSSNTAIGYWSLEKNLGGSSNTAIGFRTLYSNTSGQYNTATGYQALNSNTTASNITATGSYALFNNTTGTGNTAFGALTLYTNQSGNYNTAVGQYALYNDTASYNNAVGYYTLYNNTSGEHNIAVGYKSLKENISGNYNLAMGSEAMYSNTTGNHNVAVGESALHSGSTGINNVAVGSNALGIAASRSTIVAIGDSALYTNAVGAGSWYQGAYNTAVGSRTLRNNISGFNNTALGYKTLYTNISGSSNTAVGTTALYSLSSGSFNTAMGTHALRYNTTGSYNTSMGYMSLYNNSGNGNCAYGYYALEYNGSGEYNVALGYASMYKNITQSRNVAVGDSTLFWNGYGTSSSDEAVKNTAVGSKALKENRTGYGNTALGYQVLKSANTAYGNTGIGCSTLNGISTHSENTALGYLAYSAGDFSNSTALGANATITAGNQIRLGDPSVSSIGGWADWSNVSDKRFKTDINEDVPGIDFILKLKPVTYHYNIDAYNRFIGKTNDKKDYNAAESRLRTGFLAQDVEAAARSLGFDFDGVDKPESEKDYYGLRYARFVVPLVKATQEQQSEIEKLKTENNELKKRLERLENMMSKK